MLRIKAVRVDDELLAFCHEGCKVRFCFRASLPSGSGGNFLMNTCTFGLPSLEFMMFDRLIDWWTGVADAYVCLCVWLWVCPCVRVGRTEDARQPLHTDTHGNVHEYPPRTTQHTPTHTPIRIRANTNTIEA